MRAFLTSLAWILGGCLLAVIDSVLQGTGLMALAFPQCLIAFWVPAIVLREDSSLALKALPSFLLLDFYAATPFGLYSLALVGALYATSALFQKVFSSISALTVFAGVLFCTLLGRTLLYCLLAILVILKKTAFDFNLSIAVFAAEEAVATAFISLFSYAFYRHIFGFIPRSKGAPIRL